MAQIPQIQIKSLPSNHQIFLIVDNTFIFSIETLSFRVERLNQLPQTQELEDVDFEVLMTQKFNDSERVLLIEIHYDGGFYVILYHANPTKTVDLHLAEILEIPDYFKVKEILEKMPELTTIEKVIKKIFNIK